MIPLCEQIRGLRTAPLACCRPPDLVSLWDLMKRLNLTAIISAFANLGDLACMLSGAQGRTLAEESKARLKGDLADFCRALEDSEMDVSLSVCRELAETLELNPNAPSEFLVQELSKLLTTVRHEMNAMAAWRVPRGKLKFLEADLFGAQVHERFGRTAFNIGEAGYCLAFGRATAAVFHLMCVLEVGMDSLAHAMRLPCSQDSWNKLIDTIEHKIKAIGPQDGVAWKEDKEFYGGAALHFRFIKDAWRNHVAHGRAKYTVDEAESIFEHVKPFMQQLASRLRERSQGDLPGGE